MGDVMHKIAKLLEEEKQKNNFTATELARRIGLKQPQITKYIAGDTDSPDVDTLLKIMKYFKKPFAYFYDDQSNNDVCTASDPCKAACEICDSLPPDQQERALRIIRALQEPPKVIVRESLRVRKQ
jgi:transcriptional regulator with XRE-family HTH domain